MVVTWLSAWRAGPSWAWLSLNKPVSWMASAWVVTSKAWMAACRRRSSAKRVESQILVREQRLDLDRRCGRVAHPLVAHSEGNRHLVAVECHASDLADSDTGDSHFIARLQPGRLGEVRGIAGTAADDRQVPGEIGKQADGREDRQPDHRDRDRIALPDRRQADASHEVHLAAVTGTPLLIVCCGPVCTPVTVALQRKKLSHDPYDASLAIPAILTGRSRMN